jgi:hypothetical protein
MAVAKTLTAVPVTLRLPARVITLAIFLGSAVVSAQLICAVLSWLAGPLELWVWLVIYATQLIPALLLAGALFAAGEPAEPRRRAGD